MNQPALKPMKLRYSRASPFVRKVLVYAHELGLAEQIELIPTDVWDPATDIAIDNPLGKVPAMITNQGVLAGSTLCCDYLDGLHNTKPLLPSDRRLRIKVLQRYALADGVIESAVAHVVERLRRPQQFVFHGTLERQERKIASTLDVLDREIGEFGDIDLASITLGCALGYLDFRLDALGWRNEHNALADWYARFSTRPSMQATMP